MTASELSDGTNSGTRLGSRPRRSETLRGGPYRHLFEKSMDGVLFTRPDGTILEANPAACALLELTEDEIKRRGRTGLADPADERWAAAIAERARTGQFRGDLRMLRGDGSAVPVEVTSQVFLDDSGGEYTCVVFRDISERLRLTEELRRANENLERLAVTDPLTGLNNRRGFTLLAGQELAGAARRPQRYWLTFVDIDNMKELNDELGHTAGDEALIAVAELLRRHTRPSDVAARLGGDEFCVLFAASSQREAEAVVDRLRRADAGLVLADGRPLSVSVGLSETPASSPDDLERVLVEADRAMYREKNGTTTERPAPARSRRRRR